MNKIVKHELYFYELDLQDLEDFTHSVDKCIFNSPEAERKILKLLKSNADTIVILDEMQKSTSDPLVITFEKVEESKTNPKGILDEAQKNIIRDNSSLKLTVINNVKNTSFSYVYGNKRGFSSFTRCKSSLEALNDVKLLETKSNNMITQPSAKESFFNNIYTQLRVVLNEKSMINSATQIEMERCVLNGFKI